MRTLTVVLFLLALAADRRLLRAAARARRWWRQPDRILQATCPCEPGTDCLTCWVRSRNKGVQYAR